MSQRFLRGLSVLGATAGLLAGLVVGRAERASAQVIGSNDPCGGTSTFTYTTDHGAAQFDYNDYSGSCNSGNFFQKTYAAFTFNLAGGGPHDVTADTCTSPSVYTQVRIYQAAGGAPGAFNPGNTCLNQEASAFNTCGQGARATASGLVDGEYVVEVNEWWPANTTETNEHSGTLVVSAPTCRLPYPWFEELPVAFVNPEAVCTTGRATITVTLTNTGLADLDNNGSADEFYIDIVGAGGPVQIVSIASGTGGGGSIPARVPTPNCGLETGASVHVSLPPGATDVVTINVAFPNGLAAVRGGLLISRSTFYDEDGNGGCDDGDAKFTFAEEDPTQLPCDPTVWPNNQLARQVHLPILNFQGQDDVCESFIEVQNLGCRNAKAALVTWGEPGFCPPQAAGPLKVECTGILKPGSTWNLYGAQVPTGSKSGILFKLSARQLTEDGIDIGFDDVTGDYVCELLFFGVVGDADDYRRFKKAYNEGLEFQLVNMERAAGEGLLAVDVHRTCPGDATPGVDVTSKYNGLAGTHLGTYDDVYGGYSYYVPLVYASAAGFNTIIYIQNGGLVCSSLEIWFKARDDCLRATICDIATLAPGETYQLDANDCVGPDFQGSAWIRSTQVMGIAVDIIGGDVLMTYVGEPGEINYTFDPNKSTTKDGNQVAFGPLIYSEYQGWDTGVQVQNLSPVFAAKVKVYFLDRSGDIITTLVDWICPRGSQTFFLPVVFDLPGNWVGSMRAESQEWITPGGPNVLAPNIVGVITLIKYNDVARTQKTEAIAYNLLPEHKIYDWQLGYGAGGTDSGIGLIAIPSVLRDLENSGLTSEIAIANVVPKPGFTDLVIYFYDQNGLLDYICQKLNEKQVEYLDLQTWGYINDGFKGSAIISAWFWEHDVFDDRGFFLRNLVGLGAVSIERKGTHLGEDVPGDESAGSRGIPFAQTFDEDGEPLFEFCFMGPAPLCPGFTDNRPGPGDCDITALNGDYEFPISGAAQLPLTILYEPAGNCQNSGWNPIFNIRPSFDDPFVFDLCAPAEMTVTLTQQSLPIAIGCSGPPPEVNALLWADSVNLADTCQNLLDTSADDATFVNMDGLRLNVPYTFSDRAKTPITLAPGRYVFDAQTICTGSGGSVSITIEFN